MNDETSNGADTVGTGLYRYRLAREYIPDMTSAECRDFALIVGGTFAKEEMRRWLGVSVDLAPAVTIAPRD